MWKLQLVKGKVTSSWLWLLWLSWLVSRVVKLFSEECWNSYSWGANSIKDADITFIDIILNFPFCQTLFKAKREREFGGTNKICSVKFLLKRCPSQDSPIWLLFELLFENIKSNDKIWWKQDYSRNFLQIMFWMMNISNFWNLKNVRWFSDVTRNLKIVKIISDWLSLTLTRETRLVFSVRLTFFSSTGLLI